MTKFRVVFDTNVLIAALLSQRGASYRCLMLMDSGKFDLNVSVPLVVEYEDVVHRMLPQIALSKLNVDDILDFICAVAKHQEIFFLWRPFLRDPKDDMVLELAVAAQCEFIVTFNLKDFANIDQFAITAITPKQFLNVLGE